MGNPFIRSQAFQPAAPAEPSGNGILAKVPGQYIAQGSKQLPPAGKGLPDRMEVVLHDIPNLGSVRITYRLNFYDHGRFRHWHWVAEKAEPA